jgi:seryl-tRNA synthetase
MCYISVLQALQQNEALEAHTSSLAAAKQQLQQQLAELSASKAQLDAQVAALTEQQGGLLQHNQQLADRIEALHGSQQQMQQVAQQLQSQVADASDKLEQQQQQQEAASASGGSAASALPVAPAGVAPRQGDLSVQVSCWRHAKWCCSVSASEPCQQLLSTSMPSAGRHRCRLRLCKLTCACSHVVCMLLRMHQ